MKSGAVQLINDYFPQRTERILQLLRNRNFFHDYDAPVFNQHGGEVKQGFEAEIFSSGGTIYYTVDGSDPRTSETATVYAAPIPISETMTIRSRAQRGANEWSAVNVAAFTIPLPGDFSGNGGLDATDLDLLMAAIMGGSNDPTFDLDGSGATDDSDADFWLLELAETQRGDADLDGDVDFADFLELSSNFGSTDSNWSDGNFNTDDQVDFADFLVLSGQFGWTGDDV